MTHSSVLRLFIILSLGLFAADAEAQSASCRGTIFAYEGDKWAGSNFHCLKKPVDNYTPGIAMRFVKCGTKVRVCRVRKTKSGKTLCTVTRVIDHGPYGALLPKGDACPKWIRKCYPRKNDRLWYVKRKRGWPGKWVGCVDMTPPTAHAIQHNGYEFVTVSPVRRKRPPEKVAMYCASSSKVDNGNEIE